MKKLFCFSVLIFSVFLSFNCRDIPTVSSTDSQNNQSSSSLAKVNIPQADYFLVQYTSSENDLNKAVNNIGGVVDETHSEIKVAKVSDLTDKTAAKLEKEKGNKISYPRFNGAVGKTRQYCRATVNRK